MTANNFSNETKIAVLEAVHGIAEENPKTWDRQVSEVSPEKKRNHEEKKVAKFQTMQFSQMKKGLDVMVNGGIDTIEDRFILTRILGHCELKDS